MIQIDTKQCIDNLILDIWEMSDTTKNILLSENEIRCQYYYMLKMQELILLINLNRSPGLLCCSPHRI